MKTATLLVTLLSLLQLSAAQPRRRHAHGLAHHAQRRAFISKRDDPGTYSGQQAGMLEVVVYVDQFGNPIGTTTENVIVYPEPTPAPVQAPAELPAVQPEAVYPTVATAAPPVQPVTEVAPVAPVVSVEPPVASVPTPAPTYEQPKEPQPEPPTTYSAENPTVEAPPPSYANTPEAPASTPAIGVVNGVTYSPYKGAGGCKTAAEVEADFARFAKDHGLVRIYGVDCDQVASVYAAAKKYGNRMMLGIYDISQVDQAVSAMAAGVQNDWSIVDMVSVGNELVNNGRATVEQVLDAVAQARSALQASGFNGPVTTVDTFVAVRDHPRLCDELDICTVNIHPFFDPNTSAGQAGDFVNQAIGWVRNALADKNKRIIVTETGWPWQGNANGAAIPSLENQQAAMSSIKNAFSSNPGDCILFTAFNDPWKISDAGTFFAEQFWGIGGRYSSVDKY